MQSIGSGTIMPGEATVNIGSGGQICVQVDGIFSNPPAGVNSFCSYNSKKWYLMGASSNAGSAFKWFCNEILKQPDYSLVDTEVAAVTPGCDGLIFLPYLSGERCPHLNANIGGVFWGLSYLTDRARMARAVMEGIAFSLYDCLLACEKSGGSPGSLVALGGGANSREWLQIQADIYGKSLLTTANREQAVVGAAITAGVGVGIFSGFEEACKSSIRYNDEIFVPDPETHELYMKYFRVYGDIYRLARPALEAAVTLGREGK